MPATRTEWEVGRKMAADLIRRHPDLLKDVPPLSDILFVIDTESTPKRLGAPVLARVSKIPGKFVEFVVEGEKTFILEWFTANHRGLTINQKQVLMIRELLNFECDHDKEYPYKLRGHDFEDFRVLLDRFGYRWNDPRFGDVPDVMAADFEWGKQGQARLDLSDHVDEIAQGVAAAVPGTTVTVSAGGKEATAKADPDWQPPVPFIAPNNVVQFPGTQQPTGTDGDSA